MVANLVEISADDLVTLKLIIARYCGYASRCGSVAREVWPARLRDDR